MPKHNNLTLGAIMNKIRVIADTNYQGELDGNLNTIFMEDLTLEERRALLFFTMTLYVIFESHIIQTEDDVSRIVSVLGNSERALAESEDQERESLANIETYNRRSIVDAKSFLARIAGTAVIVVIAVCAILYFNAMLEAGTPSETLERIAPWLDTVRVAFGWK